VPSVQRLEVPVILLCSGQSAGYVAESVRDLPWASVEIQDDWYGGWRGAPEQIVTRLDSDDALRQDWFQALDRAPAGAEVHCTRDFLRLDARSGRLYSYRRREPSPLAAFRRGLNPYAHDHKHLEKHCQVRFLKGQYLLQIAHGNNLSNRLPAWWRIDRRVPRSRLAAFGLQSHASP
jgi:ribosome modulation factor